MSALPYFFFPAPLPYAVPLPLSAVSSSSSVNSIDIELTINLTCITIIFSISSPFGQDIQLIISSAHLSLWSWLWEASASSPFFPSRVSCCSSSPFPCSARLLLLLLCANQLVKSLTSKPRSSPASLARWVTVSVQLRMLIVFCSYLLLQQQEEQLPASLSSSRRRSSSSHAPPFRVVSSLQLRWVFVD